jgi:O-antigen/teichoic acid export membrane protein
LQTRRLFDRAATGGPLPEGTVPVAVGLVISGVATYGFLIITKRVLGEDAFTPVSLLWFLTFILAPGFFLPVEQEVGRSLAHRRALKQGGLPVVRKAGALDAILAASVVLVLIAISPVLVSSQFDGSWALMAALIFAFVCYAVAHLTRGVWSGTGRFGAYGTLMGSEGVIRMLLCVVVALAGIKAPGVYGFLVGLPVLAAVALSFRHQHNIVQPGPEASWGEITPNLGWLLAGSVFAAFLVNAGPIAANLLATSGQQPLVNQLTTGVIIARVPLFMFQAVQAALLPKLAQLAARGELTEFLRGFRKLMYIVVGVAAAGIVGAFILGPFAVKVLFDSDISRRTITLLAAASGIYMAALAMAQAVIALHGHAKVAVGWFVGTVTFVAIAAIPESDLLLRVELALVLASVAALVAFAVFLRRLVRAGARPDEESLIEALDTLPVES